MGFKSAIHCRSASSEESLCGIQTKLSSWQAWHEAEISIALPDFTSRYTLTNVCSSSVGFGLIQRSQIHLTSLSAWCSYCHPDLFLCSMAPPGSTALDYSDWRNTGWSNSGAFSPVWACTPVVLPALETRLELNKRCVRWYSIISLLFMSWAKKYHRSGHLPCLAKALHKSHKANQQARVKESLLNFFFWIIEMVLCDMG